ncbi:hypothetical protein [Streptomyces sp. ISL-11]|uniref:hypothetical protein n=1 Tax=Streptomyces sp. ISL-11 TaxID=2819174 RepID=UPI001BEA8923|nr:hypothetical protein [Streptomyces sp. ISL-11]MBT2383528.1 hypothetical protein [Streptomyces sp. ISL-11]
MSDGSGSRPAALLSWVMLIGGTVLAIGVGVDWARGTGFDRVTSAWLLVLWPQGLRQLLLVRGRARAATRARTIGNWCVPPAAALLWTSLIDGRARGAGMDWLVVTSAVLLSLATVPMVVGLIARRRAEC